MIKNKPINAAQFHYLFDQSFDGLLIYCPIKKKVLDCNATILKYLNCNEEQLINNSPFLFSPPFQINGQASKDEQERIEKRMLKENRFTFEWFFLVDDLIIKTAEISYLNFSELGQSSASLIIRDITDWKHTQEIIFQRDIQLKLAQEIGKIGSFYYNNDANRFYWSDGLKKIFGTSVIPSFKEYLGCIHPDDRAEHSKDIQMLTQMGNANETIVRIITTNQKIRYLSYKAHPVQTEKNIRAVIGVVQDITEQHRTSIELNKNRKRLSQVLEASNLGTWEWNILTGEAVHNKRWAEMLGYKLEEIPSDKNSFLELAHPEDLPEALEKIKDHLKGKSDFFEAELRMRHKNGQYVWIYNRGKVTAYDAEGNPTLATGIHMDINERIINEQLLKEEKEINQKVNEALINNQKILKQAQTLAKIGNWEFDLRTGKIHWSEAIFDVFEIEDKTSPTYEEYLQRIIPEDRDKVREAVKLCIAKGEPYDLEIRHIGKNNKIIYTLAHAKPVYRENEVTKIIGTIQDVSEQKQSEKIILETNIKYFDLFENMYDALLTTNANGQFVDFNKSAQQMLGYSFTEMTEIRIADIVHPDDMERSQKYLNQLVENGYYSNYQGRIINKKGEIKHVQVNSNAIYKDGKFIGSRDIVRNITNLVEANQKRDQLLDQLADANTELRDFAYVVSHDLKAPLRGISSLAQWLSMDYLDKIDEAGQQQLKLLVNRVNRMHNFIEGILEYSRIGRVKEDKEMIDTDQLIDEILEDMELPTSFRILRQSKLPKIYAERIRIKQLFQNLISNANKYNNKPDPQVEISGHLESSVACFKVRDNGMGIDKKYHEKVFQIFQTLQPRDQFESTGIGLTIVKRIVHQYKGQIKIDSILNKFTCFSFSLYGILPE